MDPAQILPVLLAIAVIAPLISFFIIFAFGRQMGQAGAYVAISAIGLSCLLSFVAMFAVWLPHHGHELLDPHDHHGDHAAASFEQTATGESPAGIHYVAAPAAANDHASHGPPPAYSGVYYLLGKFGDLRLEISYYIDSLTLCMFCMVTLIATLIHFYASGYMHDELHDVHDHEVILEDGSHLHRPGRFPRFFQYMSLFCFSMLGLVLAGNVAMVFVFWELVGICSYFLIGFYVERKSASTAANKAFIVNRVGDFGMLIGMMALWTGVGTFSFGDVVRHDGETPVVEQGLFSLMRPAERDYDLTVPAGMVLWDARREVDELVAEYRAENPDATREELQQAVLAQVDDWRSGEDGNRYGYMLLIIAGIGIFCGCVGKSAQFPLHTWLPDAMEGPTPVSALVHSATMVAAGVYLVGRFYPVFAPEVLLVIAVIGCITLFMAATIAITATDIKRVLAYSTVSQLGYMMLALGIGGWLAGMMHLITHAFFKSLLFLCSGSVIHAVHTNEMTEMGGLRRKMPVTAYTMLIGCLAIAGVSVPFVVGFSGYYSKDSILEQAFAFMDVNRTAWASVFFLFAAGGAAMTAFYMFRMWYMTFAGKPRNQERYDHAHESPRVMYVPLVILAVFAVAVAWSTMLDLLVGAAIVVLIGLLVLIWARPAKVAESHGEPAHVGHGQAGTHHDEHAHHGNEDSLRYLILGLGVLVAALGVFWLSTGYRNVFLANLLEQSRPVGTLKDTPGVLVDWIWPDEHFAHLDEQFTTIKVPVTLLAFATGLGGIALATLMYGLGWLNPGDVRRQFQPIHRFLVNKWWFDELYDFLFVRPTHVISRFFAGFDRNWIDWLIDGSAKVTCAFARGWERVTDQIMVDGTLDVLAGWCYSFGVSLHRLQTGKLRQYLVFIVVGTIVLFLLVSFFWSPAQAIP